MTLSSLGLVAYGNGTWRTISVNPWLQLYLSVESPLYVLIIDAFGSTFFSCYYYYGGFAYTLGYSYYTTEEDANIGLASATLLLLSGSLISSLLDYKFLFSAASFLANSSFSLYWAHLSTSSGLWGNFLKC